MVETYNVFISWSGPRSKAAAEAIEEWLPTILQAARPWMSATDIDKGTRWREEVTTALDTMKAGIICLTPENLTAEWLLFEAGALSKVRDPKARVWTFLLADLKPKDIKDPLAMFQATIADREDTRKLIHSVNQSLDAGLAEKRVNFLFDKLWPDLEAKLSALPAASVPAPPKRSADEIAADSLELLRTLAPTIQEIATETGHARRKRLMEEQSPYLNFVAARHPTAFTVFPNISDNEPPAAESFTVLGAETASPNLGERIRAREGAERLAARVRATAAELGSEREETELPASREAEAKGEKGDRHK